MLMSALMVVYGQMCEEVGSGENEMSNGCAVGSERRWNCGSMVSGSGVLGYCIQLVPKQGIGQGRSPGR